MGAVPIAFDTSSCLQKKWTFLMACTHSVRTPDMEKLDTSEDSDMEVIVQLVEQDV